MRTRKWMCCAALVLTVAVADGVSGGAEETPIDPMDGLFWRTQVLEELMPLWYDHVRDVEHGAFYTNLSRDWQPRPPWDKIPAMISRQVFSFSAAYLLSGEEKYLQVARDGVDYLLEHGWDRQYGGWFTGLDQAGEPTGLAKGAADQLYTDVGLTIYYMTTGDSRALAYVDSSVQIRRTRSRDAEFGGYFHTLEQDLTPRIEGKTKHAHYGYVGSLLLNLYLATRDPAILAYAEELTDLSVDRMIDPELGWIYGLSIPLDRQWRPVPPAARDVVSIGAQLTASLSFLRLYHQSGIERYWDKGRALADLAARWGWDAQTGAWLDLASRKEPHTPIDGAAVSWWIQIYGAFAQLQLYQVTGDPAYLERFRRSEEFFLAHMVDAQYGGVFATVSPRGELVDDGRKASPWHTSYHEIEHGLLNYLYLNLYVNGDPAVLHFRLDGGDGGKTHYVSPVDDPSVSVSSVKIDGVPWDRFDAAARSVSLPAGGDLRVEVTLSPAPRKAQR